MRGACLHVRLHQVRAIQFPLQHRLRMCSTGQAHPPGTRSRHKTSHLPTALHRSTSHATEGGTRLGPALSWSSGPAIGACGLRSRATSGGHTWCMPAMVASATGQRGAPTWHSPRAPATVMALVVKLLASVVAPTPRPAAQAAALQLKGSVMLAPALAQRASG